MNINEKLVVTNKTEYGENFDTHCLEIYKVYVETADRISSRRQSANSFFLAVNTTIIGVVSYVSGSSNDFLWIVSLAGIALCFVWYRIIRAYKDINSGKFKVIHQIEKHLPLSPYDAEWEAVGRGKDPKLYLPFTRIESRVPIIFAALHMVVLLRVFPWSDLISSAA